MAAPAVFKILQSHFDSLLQDSNLANTNVSISCKTLTPEEAIGSPGRDDFPLQKGKEKLMQAEIDGFIGQAYTDMPGNYKGTLRDALMLPPVNNYNRAVIIASINALYRKYGKIANTIHCKDAGPEKCSQKLVDAISSEYGNPSIVVFGLQPAMVGKLASHFELRVFDLDTDNIGKIKNGITIENGNYDLNAVENSCDLILATGSMIVNGTIDPFLKIKKPVLFYGTTIAAPAEILGLKRFCPVSS